jgi:signal transduction histidine kinase/ActR/RegA family two-component response regulator
MLLHKLVPFFALVLNLLLLASALASDGRSPRNRRFALLALVLAVWSLGVLGLRWSEDPALALMWQRFLHFGVVAIPVAFYEYVRALVGDTRRWRSLVAAYVLGSTFMLAVPTSAFMTGVKTTQWGFAPVAGPLYAPFLVYFVGYTALGLARLVRAHASTASTFRKNRIRLVIVGVLVSLLGGLIDFGRFTAGVEWVYPPGVPASMVFALALGVAIVRYRLMDLTVAAKRVLLYAIAWAVTAPLLLLAVGAVDMLSGRPAPGGTTPVRTVVVLLTVLMLALPLMRKLEVRLDRLMFRRDRAIRDTLVALNKEISAILDVDRLATTLTTALAAGIPAAHATLYVPARPGGAFVAAAHAVGPSGPDVSPARELDPRLPLQLAGSRRTLVVDEIAYRTISNRPASEMIKALERQSVALVLPVSGDSELTAVLAVGDKLSGEVFDPAEIELLEILAGQTATALSNARLYEDLAVQMAELRKTQDLYGQAREANRAKQEFLAMLAHELRNPLAPILNAAHALDATVGGTSEASKRLIDIIRRQGQQLARLVDDLLDVSRIQLGKIRLATEALDIRDVVGRCLQTLRASGKGHGRVLRVRFADEPLAVRGDRVRLEQVFWNLLDNAIKYSPPDRPVTVTVDRDGEAAVVRIADRGVGIAPEILPRIFDLFTQAHTSLDRSQGGLGLGLALVRSLVDQHGGSVLAHSAGLGHGTELVVRLPLASESPAGGEPRPSVGQPPCSRVLVVEDIADTRESLRAVLEADGHRVQCAEDGLTAIDIALGWAPQVALIDIGLPGIDGYEVARRLRASSLGRNVYLVAVTGYGQPEDRVRAMESGFDAHIVKPAREDDLRRALERSRRSPMDGEPTERT